MRNVPRALVAVVVAAALVACDESDAVAVRVTVQPDFSGTVSTSVLAVPASAGPVEGACTGASWTNRAELSCSTGTFARLDRLGVADIAFAHGVTPEGIGYLRVTLPRGEGARWPDVLLMTDAERRGAAAAALDPTGRFDRLGESLKLAVELPAQVATEGFTPNVAQIDSSVDGRSAEMVVKLDAALSEGEPILWTLTWNQ